MSKTIEQKYKKLTDIQHCLTRPTMYLGSTSLHTEDQWIYENNGIIKKQITYQPAFIKLFDEIISNSIDESIRNPKLDTIKIEIDEEKISVYDNGGIPVQKHKEHDQWVPEMIFKELKAGSNFDDTDDRTQIGMNGVGSSLVNIFSTKFIVETADGKKSYKQIFSENNHKASEPKINDSDKKFTKITYYPDYKRLQVKFDNDHKLKLEKRVIDAAGCNPHLKIYLNGEKIKINSFSDYIKLYSDNYFYEENNTWKVGISHSKNGFESVGFVNSTNVNQGTHINYIADQIVVKVREFIKKKYKQEVKPSDIKNHFFLFVNATIINPQFSSQTKENLITDSKNFKDSIVLSDKFIKKVLQSEIIQSILDWCEAKQLANEKAELRKLNRNTDKGNLRKITKLSDATSIEREKCMIMFVEGDSASGSTKSARDTKYQAVFPLRGKPLNVKAHPVKKLIENEEFANIMAICGLKIGEKVESISQLRYGKICILSDQDFDGSNITLLLLNLFHEFWPELFKMGVLYRFITPYVKVFLKNETLEFYSQNEYLKWKEKNPNINGKIKHFKGLGTSTTNDFKEYYKKMDKCLIPLTIDDVEDDEMFTLLFSKDAGKANERKEWLNLE